MQFKGSDNDLYQLYLKARRDIDAHLAGQPVYEDDMAEVVEESDRI
jgi:hypothetical protein